MRLLPIFLVRIFLIVVYILFSRFLAIPYTPGVDLGILILNCINVLDSHLCLQSYVPIRYHESIRKDKKRKSFGKTAD